MSDRSNTEANIAQFCSHFEAQADVISGLSLTADQTLRRGSVSPSTYRKILFSAAIDALAGIRFPRSAYPRMGNRERFMRFVSEHGSWTDASLVSVPFLSDLLADCRLSDTPLGHHVGIRLLAFSTDDGGTLPVSEIDQPERELASLAHSMKEEEAIARCQHLSLFYGYRNHLVHEYREPGTAMEVHGAQPPYYHGYIGDPKWYLVYSLFTFENIVRQCIANLKAYLFRYGVDPYDAVKETSRWG